MASSYHRFIVNGKPQKTPWFLFTVTSPSGEYRFWGSTSSMREENCQVCWKLYRYSQLRKQSA
jgi:hypothetical protein